MSEPAILARGVLTAQPGRGLGRWSLPSSRAILQHCWCLPSTFLQPWGEGSADLFDGDGPATPDAVHLALGCLLLPVQVSTLSRLEEKRRGMSVGARGLRGFSCPPGIPSWHPTLPESLPPPGQALAARQGRAGWARRDREGMETTSIPTGVYSYTRHHTEQHRSSLGRARPSQKSEDMRCRGLRSAQPGGQGRLGPKRREGARTGEVDGGGCGLAGSSAGHDHRVRGERSPEVRAGRGTDTPHAAAL